MFSFLFHISLLASGVPGYGVWGCQKPSVTFWLVGKMWQNYYGLSVILGRIELNLPIRIVVVVVVVFLCCINFCQPHIVRFHSKIRTLWLNIFDKTCRQIRSNLSINFFCNTLHSKVLRHATAYTTAIEKRNKSLYFIPFLNYITFPLQNASFACNSRTILKDQSFYCWHASFRNF